MPLMTSTVWRCADRIGKEFKLTTIIHGSGEEFRRAEEIARTERPVIVPVKSFEAAARRDACGQRRVARRFDGLGSAPENAMRLQLAGVKFAFTSDGLKDRGAFLTNIRKAVVCVL